MKRFLSLFLSLAITASAFAAPAAPAASGTGKTKKTKAAQAATESDVAKALHEMQEALQAQQQQIQKLSQAVQARDEHIQQLEQKIDQSQAAATQAQSKADSAASQTAEQQQTVSTLKSDVTDLKTTATSTAQTIQEEQKRVGDLESPVAIHYKGTTITPGGFIAAESVWRQRALSADINSAFNAVPFPGSSQSDISEFFASGRQSRLSLLVEGKFKTTKLSGYYESDFLSAATTSNNNQSNSYSLRERQLWAQAAFHNGWTVTGGQMWSLLTETKKGLDNRSEALPMTIDAQYTAGFSWARQYGFRVTKNINDKVYFGVSLENPQTTFAAHGNASNFVLGTTGNPGGLYNPLANYSFNAAPDIIFKAAAEPGWGHYEVFGVVSQFRDRVFPNATATTPSAAGAFNDHRTGGGIGFNARAPIGGPRMDLGIHFLGGNGIGRYGSVGLPDSTVRPDGTLALLRSYQSLGTLEIHGKQWDIYLNGGGEYVGRAAYLNSAGKPVGYGSPLFNNAGCSTETLPGSTGFGPGALANCTGDTRSLLEGSFGFWYRLYNGPKGKLQFGPQYSYIVRHTWTGLAGEPQGTENMFLTSFRYYLP